MTRATGYPVHVVDQEALTEALRSAGYLLDDYVVTPLAVVRTANGLATICTEGVGWNETEDGLLGIEIWAGYINQYPDVPAHLVLDNLAKDTVELADFIRVFGDRLENNFGLWRRAIDGIDQTMEVANAN
jgi:hypothetical protein